MGEETKHQRTFFLTFAQPLNMGALTERIRAASRHIHWVQPNNFARDGNRITFEQIGASKRCTFSQG